MASTCTGTRAETRKGDREAPATPLQRVHVRVLLLGIRRGCGCIRPLPLTVPPPHTAACSSKSTPPIPAAAPGTCAPHLPLVTPHELPPFHRPRWLTLAAAASPLLVCGLNAAPVIHQCFGAFHNIWVHLVLFHYYTKIGAKQAELMQLCKSSCHEMALEFFATNAPNPDHWTLNSYFVANLTGGNGGRRAEMARRHRG